MYINRYSRFFVTERLFFAKHIIQVKDMEKKSDTGGGNKTRAFRLNENSREKFRDIIIQRLEKIDSDWQQPWLSVNPQFIPRNLYQNKAFRGMNAFITAWECQAFSYKTPYYLTMGQIINENGDQKYSGLSIRYRLRYLEDELGDLGMPVTKKGIDDYTKPLREELAKGISLLEKSNPALFAGRGKERRFILLNGEARQALEKIAVRCLSKKDPSLLCWIKDNRFLDCLEGMKVSLDRNRMAEEMMPYFDTLAEKRIQRNLKLIKQMGMEHSYRDKEGNTLSPEEFISLSLEQKKECSHVVHQTESSRDITFNTFYERTGTDEIITAHDYYQIEREKRHDFTQFKVRKDYEAPTPIIFFSPYYYSAEAKPSKLTVEKWKELPTQEERDRYSIRFLERVTAEYNLDQTDFADKYPEAYDKLVRETKPEKEDLERVIQDVRVPTFDKMIADPDCWLTDHVYVGEEGVPQSHVDEAYFHPKQEGASGIAATNYIHLPDPKLFDTMRHFYSTAAHEFCHSTKIRKDRDYGRMIWGDHGYALEELVAEIGSAAICMQLGIERTVSEDNLKYVKNWIEACNEKPEVIATIIDDVWDATDIFMGQYNQTFRQLQEAGELADILLQDEDIKESQIEQELPERTTITFLDGHTEDAIRDPEDGLYSLSSGKVMSSQDIIRGYIEGTLHYDKSGPENTHVPYRTGEFFAIDAAIRRESTEISRMMALDIPSPSYTLRDVTLCTDGKFKKLKADIEITRDRPDIQYKKLRVENYGRTSPATRMLDTLQKKGISLTDLPLQTLSESMRAVSKATVRIGKREHGISLERTADNQWDLRIEAVKCKGRQRHDVLVK